jgi:putative FmdB family regulatory protein
MPIYEYVCTKCHRRCEVLQRLSDPLLKECRVCGGALKKITSAPAIQFKGSGWYITDYAKKSSPDKSETKKESKAEDKTESCKDTSDKKKPAAAPAKE